MSTVRYVLTDLAPLPDAFAELMRRKTSSQTKFDTWTPGDTHGTVHVSTSAAEADRAAGYFLDKLGVPYSVRAVSER
jgi:hypothetical protein